MVIRTEEYGRSEYRQVCEGEPTCRWWRKAALSNWKPLGQNKSHPSPTAWFYHLSVLLSITFWTYLKSLGFKTCYCVLKWIELSQFPITHLQFQMFSFISFDIFLVIFSLPFLHFCLTIWIFMYNYEVTPCECILKTHRKVSPPVPFFNKVFISHHIYYFTMLGV